MATSFVGPSAVNVFVMITLKSGLRLYKNTGMKPNRNWTPRNMMAEASRQTGKKFKTRDYDAAIAALEEAITNAKLAPGDSIS